MKPTPSPISATMQPTFPLPDPDAVLAEATLNAAKCLGMSQAQLGQALGRDRSRLKASIRVESKAGELALMIIRCYRSLFAMVDGDAEAMKHWMHVHNYGTGGIPIDQITTIQGLVTVTGYLDAIRGKV